MCMCAWFCTRGARGVGKHALEHSQKDIYVSAEIIASFWDRGSQTWTLSDKGLGALGCRGAERRPMSYCMSEPMRTAQSLWRWHTCGGYTAKMLVESLAYRQVLDTRTRASMNVRLRHLVNEQVKLKRNGRKKSSSSHLKMLRRCLCAVFESVRMVRVETSQGTCSWVGRCVIVLHMSHKFSYTCAWSVHIFRLPVTGCSSVKLCRAHNEDGQWDCTAAAHIFFLWCRLECWSLKAAHSIHNVACSTYGRDRANVALAVALLGVVEQATASVGLRWWAPVTTVSIARCQVFVLLKWLVQRKTMFLWVWWRLVYGGSRASRTAGHTTFPQSTKQLGPFAGQQGIWARSSGRHPTRPFWVEAERTSSWARSVCLECPDGSSVCVLCPTVVRRREERRGFVREISVCHVRMRSHCHHSGWSIWSAGVSAWCLRHRALLQFGHWPAASPCKKCSDGNSCRWCVLGDSSSWKFCAFFVPVDRVLLPRQQDEHNELPQNVFSANTLGREKKGFHKVRFFQKK